MRISKPVLLLTLLTLICSTYSVSQDQASPAQAEQQKLQAHAKHFTYLDTDKPYFQRQAAADGTVDLSAGMLNDYAAAPEGTTIPPQDQLKQLLNAFPVVIVATATKQMSALTARQSFLYSDWSFEVTDVIKNASSLPVAEHQQVTVTRSGGFLTVNNRKLVAHDRNFPDFQLGHSYLLCLKPLPESKSFLANATGSFDVSGAKVLSLDDPLRQTDLRAYTQAMSPGSFIAEAHSLEQQP